MQLKPGTSKLVRVPLLSLPAVANGNYFLVAQVTDPNADITTTSTSGTYQLAAPYLSLAHTGASIVMQKNGTTIVKFQVTNGGNITPASLSTVSINTSPDDTVANSQPVATQQINLRIPPAKTKNVTIKLSALNVTTLQTNPYGILVVTDPLGGIQVITLPTFTG